MTRRPALPSPPHEAGVTHLGDGRTIGWASFGDPDGDAVFWFHGTPGARAQIPHDLPAEAERRRIRIIGVERPGTGDSSRHSYGAVVDFVPDLVAVADDLGVGQFAAVGLSGGGPFVLAAAHELPERMTAGVVIGGMGPTCGADTVISYTMLLRFLGGPLQLVKGPLSSGLSRFMRAMGPYGGPFIDGFFQFELGDRHEMAAKMPTKRQLVADLVDAAYRSGVESPFEDLIILGRHWGFELGDIKVPIVFWAGTSDIIVPYRHAERQWKRVPGSTLRTCEGRGHFAGYTEIDEVLDVIRQRWPAVRSAPEPKKRAPARRKAPAAKKAKASSAATGSTRKAAKRPARKKAAPQGKSPAAGSPGEVTRLDVGHPAGGRPTGGSAPSAN